MGEEISDKDSDRDLNIPDKVYFPVCFEAGRVLYLNNCKHEHLYRNHMSKVYVAGYLIQTLMRCKTREKYDSYKSRFLNILKLNPSYKDAFNELFQSDELAYHAESLPSESTLKGSNPDFVDYERGIIERVNYDLTLVVLQHITDDIPEFTSNDNGDYRMHTIYQMNYTAAKEKNRYWKETGCIVKCNKKSTIAHYMHPSYPLFMLAYMRDNYVALSFSEVPTKELTTIYLPVNPDSEKGYIVDCGISQSCKTFAAATDTSIYIVDLDSGSKPYRIVMTSPITNSSANIITSIRFSSTSPDVLYIGTRLGHIYSVKIQSAEVLMTLLVPSKTPVLDMYDTPNGELIIQTILESFVFDVANEKQYLIQGRNCIMTQLNVGKYLYTMYRDGEIIGTSIASTEDEEEDTDRHLPCKHQFNIPMPYEWNRSMRYDRSHRKLYVTYPDGTIKSFNI